MIKPDGVQRGLVGQIIQRFESKGFFLRGMKMMSVEKAHAEKHYADLSSKPFFGDLVDYMCSGPVVCMVWEGKEVVKTGRKIIGATNPLCVPSSPPRERCRRRNSASPPQLSRPPRLRARVASPLTPIPRPRPPSPQRLRARHHPRRLLHRAGPQRHPRLRRRRVRAARDRPLVPRGRHLVRALRQDVALRVNRCDRVPTPGARRRVVVIIGRPLRPSLIPNEASLIASRVFITNPASRTTLLRPPRPRPRRARLSAAGAPRE